MGGITAAKVSPNHVAPAYVGATDLVYVFVFALAFAGAFFGATFFFGAAFFLTLPLGGIAARASISCAASSNVSSLGEIDLGTVALVVPSVT